MTNVNEAPIRKFFRIFAGVIFMVAVALTLFGIPKQLDLDGSTIMISWEVARYGLAVFLTTCSVFCFFPESIENKFFDFLFFFGGVLFGVGVINSQFNIF